MQEQRPTIPQLVDDVRAGKLTRRQLITLLTTMGISAAGIGAIIATIVQPMPAKPASTIHSSNNPEHHLHLHDQHLAHQQQGDIPALHHDYAEHAIVEDSMFAEPVVGRNAILARKTMGLAAVTNAEIRVSNRIAAGNQVTVEWIATGIHTGDLPDLPATGRPYTLYGVTVVVREHEKIVREALYYDAQHLYAQLRGTER